MNPLVMSERLYDHYESIAEVKHYYGLLAIYGLVLTAEATNNEQLLERCKAILRRFQIKWSTIVTTSQVTE